MEVTADDEQHADLHRDGAQQDQDLCAERDRVGGGGANASLTVTLGENAPTGGLALSVAYDYSGSASETDTGTTPATLTVPENTSTATLTIPLASDDLVEGDETFTRRCPRPWRAGCAASSGASGTVTIEDDDDDDARVAFGTSATGTAKLAVSVDENVSGGTLNVPVTVSGLPGSSTTFVIEVLNTGTATEYVSAQSPGDFRIDTKSVTFGPTDTDNTKNVAVTITNDSDLEPDETIELRIAAASDPITAPEDRYARDANGALATVTITNDEHPPAPTALMVTKGDAKLDLSWTAPTVPSGTLTGYDVHYTSAPASGNGSVADGAAVQTGAQATAAGGWLDASHSGTDPEHEITGLDNATEYRVRVRARNAAGAGAWLTGTGTPEEADTTAPTVSSAAVDGASLTIAFDENLAAAANLANSAFEVKKTPASGSEQTVTLSGSPSISGDTVTLTLATAAAHGDTDVKVSYTKPASGSDNTLEDAAGNEVASFTDQAVTNNTKSSDATLMSLAGSTSTDGSDFSGTLDLSAFASDTTAYTVTVADNVTHVKLTPTVSDSDASVKVGKQGTTLASVTSGTASAAIALAAGDNVIEVEVTADDGSTQTYTVTVRNRTKTYALSATASAAEGANASLTVTLGENAPTGGLALSVTYDYTGSASETDTGTTPGTLTVAENTSTATLTIPLASDDLVEGDETFTAALSTAVAGWVAASSGASGTVTIEDDDDDDARVAFGTSATGTAKLAVSVDENVSGGTLNVPVTVSGLPGSSTTFVIEVLNTGTATEYVSAQSPGDFRIETKSVTFGPTDTDNTKNVAVTITNDSDLESDETIELRIAAASNPITAPEDRYARDANGALAAVTIVSDEAPAAPYMPTAGTLVSNVGQGQTSAALFASGTGGVVYAQRFTTGNNAGGYNLASISAYLQITGVLNAAQRGTINAELWSSRTVATIQTPNAKLHDLTVPQSVTTGTVSFAAPPNTTLDANTGYFLVLYVNDSSRAVGGRVRAGLTRSFNEDSGAAPGWGIEPSYSRILGSFTPSGTWLVNSIYAMRIRVSGSAVFSPATTLTLSTDATNDTAAEDAGTVTVTATLDNPAGTGGMEVTLSAANASTATATDDYTLPAAFTISEGADLGHGRRRHRGRRSGRGQRDRRAHRHGRQAHGP